MLRTYISDLFSDFFVDLFLDQRFGSHDVEEEGHQDARRFVASEQKDERLREDLFVIQS